jgi:fused signal recognition particle receptor
MSNKYFTKMDEEALKKGLEKTKTGFFNRLSKAVAGRKSIDIEVLDELEEILIASDVGLETTIKIINRLEERVAKDKYSSLQELNMLLREEISALLLKDNVKELQGFNLEGRTKPYVLMVVGVNGVGKTTTIGKLAHQFKQQGKKLVLGAADTFRAAAVDQLKLWGERTGTEVVSRGMNTDPSAVAFDAVERGVEVGADMVIVDTAGRLHTKVNLMNELSKIRRVMGKVNPDAPHEVMLVLDGSTGQNAIIQAKAFTEATNVNSLAITKLDGTAKGGVIIGISDQFSVPIKYVGVGEKPEDLRPFQPQAFINSMFD